MAAELEHCRECYDEIDFGDGRDICETCDQNPWETLTDEPVWYSLSEIIHAVQDLPTKPWQELMALAQILHDLRIHDTNQLMRNLGAVYVDDDSKPLRGEYHYLGGETDPDRHHSEIGSGHAPKEAKEPKLSNRRQAIMAQKERKNEGS